MKRIAVLTAVAAVMLVVSAVPSVGRQTGESGLIAQVEYNPNKARGADKAAKRAARRTAKRAQKMQDAASAGIASVQDPAPAGGDTKNALRKGGGPPAGSVVALLVAGALLTGTGVLAYRTIRRNGRRRNAYTIRRD